MRLRRRGWVFLALVTSCIIAASVPIIHPLEFAHGDVFIQGFFPTWTGRQGIYYSVITDRGDVMLRFYNIHLGPFAWEIRRNYWHS
jgi:hypothetical protein